MRGRGACDEPHPSCDELFPTAVEDDAPGQLVCPGGEDDCLGGGCSEPACRLGGDDDYLEEDAPSSLLDGGDDDCVGGGCSSPLAAMW